MFVRERKAIKVYNSDKGLFATIELSNLANPESVSITYRKKKMIPESFDMFGHPIFSEKQALMYEMIEDDLRIKKGSAYREALATVEYEAIFPTYSEKELEGFNTVEGISRNLVSLKSINEVLEYRRKFVFSKNKKLNEFMILGCFKLSPDGYVLSIVREQKGKVKYKKCEKFEDFLANNTKNGNYVSFSHCCGGYVIPKYGKKCPCCNKVFTVKDLTDDPCILVEGDTIHYSCYKEFMRIKTIDYFNRIIMGSVYKAKDYTYELLPNGYWNEEYNSHIPWFKFHTIHGDIIIGQRKRVVSIEWQENYKKVDFAEIFFNEKTTKWEEKGKFGIHAWNEDTVKYLEMVVKAVDPEYKR